MNADDFRFFCREFELPVATSPTHQPSIVVPNNSAFVGLHFIEIGGDHLDRLVSYNLRGEIEPCAVRPQAGGSNLNPSEFESFLKNVLQRSDELLNESVNVLYFINAKNLFKCCAGNCVAAGCPTDALPILDEDNVKLLVKRFLFLATRGTVDVPLRLHVFVSRLPDYGCGYPNVHSGDNMQCSMSNEDAFTLWMRLIADQIVNVLKELDLLDCSTEDVLDVLKAEMDDGDKIGGSCRTPFLEEWGEAKLQEKESGLESDGRNPVFRVIRVSGITWFICFCALLLLTPCSVLAD